MLWKTKDKAIVERFGLWLLQRNRALGLKVSGPLRHWASLSKRFVDLSSIHQLFSDPKQTLTFETRDLFGKIRAVDGDAADQYLEGAVLQERDTVSLRFSADNLIDDSLTFSSRRRIHDCTPTSSNGTSTDWQSYWVTLRQNLIYVSKVRNLSFAPSVLAS